MSYSLSVRAGNTFTRLVQWTEDDGTPIDLTDASVEWSLRNGLVVRQFIDDAHVSVTDALEGEVILFLSDVETREIRESGTSVFRYELTVTLASGFRQTILFGFISFDWEAVP
jgi:hypothetical protein